jgi:molybdopterin synthase sulfur carrier subunit
MPTVKFTYALQRFFPGLKNTAAKGNTLTAVLNEIEASYPGVRSYLLDEQGSLRQHVNIFIDGTIIKDRNTLSDLFSESSEIYILQALSGG